MKKSVRPSELDIARDMWYDWVQAERAVQSGQEYKIGSRYLRRADLEDIRAAIKYWKGEIDRLEGKTRIRVQQVIPRDM